MVSVQLQKRSELSGLILRRSGLTISASFVGHGIVSSDRYPASRPITKNAAPFLFSMGNFTLRRPSARLSWRAVDAGRGEGEIRWSSSLTLSQAVIEPLSSTHLTRSCELVACLN